MLVALAIGCSGDDPPPTRPPTTAADADGRLLGSAAEAFGLVVGSVGDVDGDGVPDFAAAGIAGRVCVGSAGLRGDADASECVAAEDPADSFGAAIDGGVDADGHPGDEWAVGAPSAGGIGTGAGAAYVLSGVPGSAADAWMTAHGSAPLDGFGTSVRWLDLDDDGVMDLVVGAPGYDTLVADTGAVYVYFGPLEPGDHGTIDAGGKFEGGLPQRHLGAPGNALGASIGSVDADGDGVADLVLSQGGTDGETGEVDAGAAFLFYGPVPRASLYAPGFADLVFVGTRAGEFASEPVDGGGDLTGDGVDDVVIAANGTAPERLLVYSNPLPPQDRKVYLEDPDLELEAAVPGEGSGWALGTRGDVDGDGQPDLLVGSPYGGASASGEVRVLLGPIGTGVVDLADVPAIEGAASGDEVGKGLAEVGDADHDGNTDFLIGAPQAEGGRGEVLRYRGY